MVIWSLLPGVPALVNLTLLLSQSVSTPIGYFFAPSRLLLALAAKRQRFQAP
jgi:amino acid permease